MYNLILIWLFALIAFGILFTLALMPGLMGLHMLNVLNSFASLIVAVNNSK